MEDQNTMDDAEAVRLPTAAFSGRNLISVCKFLESFCPDTGQVVLYWNADDITFAVRHPDTKKTLNITISGETIESTGKHADFFPEIFFPLSSLKGLSKITLKGVPDKVYIIIDPDTNEVTINAGIEKRFNYTVPGE